MRATCAFSGIGRDVTFTVVKGRDVWDTSGFIQENFQSEDPAAKAACKCGTVLGKRTLRVRNAPSGVTAKFFLFYQGKNVRFQNPSAMTIVAWKLYRRPAHPHLVLFLEERLKFSVFSFPPASWKSSTTTKSFVSVLRSQRLCKLMRQLTTWRCSVSVLVRLSVAPPERFPLPSRREGNQGLFPTATKVSATIQQRTRTS